jgi:hypothetical protein
MGLILDSSVAIAGELQRMSAADKLNAVDPSLAVVTESLEK